MGIGCKRLFQNARSVAPIECHQPSPIESRRRACRQPERTALMAIRSYRPHVRSLSRPGLWVPGRGGLLLTGPGRSLVTREVPFPLQTEAPPLRAGYSCTPARGPSPHQQREPAQGGSFGETHCHSWKVPLARAPCHVHLAGLRRKAPSADARVVEGGRSAQRSSGVAPEVPPRGHPKVRHCTRSH